MRSQTDKTLERTSASGERRAASRAGRASRPMASMRPGRLLTLGEASRAEAGDERSRIGRDRQDESHQGDEASSDHRRKPLRFEALRNGIGPRAEPGLYRVRETHQ